MSDAMAELIRERDTALAEVERLRGAAPDIERLTDTYTVEGTEIVLNRIHDLRRERDEAREALAAVAATLASHAPHIDRQGCLICDAITVLADHAGDRA